MKLLLITDDSYPFAGGTTRVCRAIAEYMSGRGHEVMIVGPRDSDPSAAFIYRARSLRPFNVPQGSLRPSKRDWEAVEAFSPDVIHTHTERGGFFWAQKLRDALGIPHMHTMHADYTVLHPYHPEARLLSIYLWLLEKKFKKHVSMPKILPDYYQASDWLLRTDWRFTAQIPANVDFYTTPSPRIHDLVNTCGYGDKGILLPFGIEESWISTTPKHAMKSPATILWVGRMASEKRPGTMLDAFFELRKQGVDARLSFAGEGEEIERLQAVVDKTPYVDDVTFHGLIRDKSALRNLYNQADLFALTSYHFETQGLVLLEAAGAGLPIVYCDDRLVTGVTSDNAILTDPTPEALARGMAKIITQPALQSKLAAGSITQAKKFPLSETMSAFESAYKQLMKSGDV